MSSKTSPLRVSDRYSVAPIGSCRIAGPLRLAQQRCGIWVNRTKSYGYCHSVAEAVQMARYFQGDFNPPADIWPLMSRDQDHAQSCAAQHVPADRYVVEISSAKEITIDGVCVQLNYLQATYQDFFADRSRAQAFWACASQDDPAAIDRNLSTCWPGDDRNEDRHILRRIRLRMASRDMLRTGMVELRERLGRPLIVTHVNALQSNGQPIHTRVDLIRLVTEVARDVSLDLFDPTTLLTAYGQQIAMADDTSSLAHYADVFSAAIAAEWAQEWIIPAIDRVAKSAPPERADPVFSHHLQARLDHGFLTGLTERIDAVQAKRRDVDFSNFGQKVTDAIKKGAAEYRGLTHAKNIGLDSPGQVLGRLNLAMAAGDAGLACRVYKAATDIGIAIPSHWIFAAAEQCRLAKDMQGLAKLLLCALASPGHRKTAALRLAGLIVQGQLEAGDHPGLPTVLPYLPPPDQVRVAKSLDLTPVFDPASLSPDVLVDVASAQIEAGDIPATLATVAAWQGANPSTPCPNAIAACLGKWLSQTAPHPVALLRDVLAVFPTLPDARDAMKAMRRVLREQIAQAVANKDIGSLDTLAASNDLLDHPLPEIALHQARLRFALGDYAEAGRAGLSAVAQNPDRLSSWVLLMRAAVKTGDHAGTDRFARKVLGLCAAKDQRFAQEASKYLGHRAEAI